VNIDGFFASTRRHSSLLPFGSIISCWIDEVNFLSCLSWHNSSGNIVFCCQLFLYPFAFIIPVTRRVNGVYQIRREVSNMWKEAFSTLKVFIFLTCNTGTRHGDSRDSCRFLRCIRSASLFLDSVALNRFLSFLGSASLSREGKFVTRITSLFQQ